MNTKFSKAFFFVLLLITNPLISQTSSYNAFSIKKELKENANAVVRNHNIQIDVVNSAKIIIQIDRVITVLNKLGNSNVGAYVHYDDNSKITKLTATIYDALGNEVQKISKNKFIDVSAVDGGTLYSDSRVKYLDYTPVSYPYTVHFEYEKESSSTLFTPNWKPIEGYLLGIENSSYTLNLSTEKARVKEVNFEGYEITKDISSSKIQYTVKNVPGIRNESYSPLLKDIEPAALIALNSFRVDGVSGYYTNWDEFGKWMYSSLLEGRNAIDQETKTAVLELVKNVNDPLEKAKIVYKYMQDKTRYISVQVGIGGIQPIPALEVDKVGYGDCKGLTNYTKALLDVVGVTSYYTVVESNTSEPVSLESDFASFQGNHVILNLPYNGKDIWLECTSQITPFGFLGSFTDDRDVLVITPEGGKIKRTTSYKNEQNLQETKAKIVLNNDGTIKADVNIESYGIQYDNKYWLETKDIKEQKTYYTSSYWNYNNNMTINSLTIKNNKDSIVLVENLNTTINDYGTITSDQMLIRVNVFNVNSSTPNRYRNRMLPLKISRGFKDFDEFLITIPSNYKIENNSLINNEVETKFGVYKIALKKINENQIMYTRTLLIKEGTYPKEDYDAYRDFRKKIAKTDNLRIALIKK